MLNFIILCILHVIGDFYLQTNKVAKCKSARIDSLCGDCSDCKDGKMYNLKFLFLHILLYIVPFTTIFFMTSWLRALLIIGICAISHLIIDFITSCLRNKFKQSLLFILDQILHIAILFAVFKFFKFNNNFAGHYDLIKIVFVCSLILVPSSIFISKLYIDIFNDSSQINVFEKGSIIGILERILVLIFACFNDFAAIAIIITVKTWARSIDIKENEKDFREKYLLGTLASLVISLLCFLIYKAI